MPVNTAEMRQNRHALIESTHAILDLAEHNRRTLTMEEKRRYDDNKKEIQKLSTQIIENEEVNDRERDEAKRFLRNRNGGETTGGPSFRTSTGEIVRTIRRDESIRSLIDLPANEERMSFGAYVKGIVTGDWRGAEVEHRYVGGASTAGGYLVSPQMSAQVIDLARAQSVLVKAGTLTAQTTSDEFTVARVDSDPVASWTSETGLIPESQATFGLVKAHPQWVAILAPVSLQLLETASNAQSVIENVMGKALGAAIDAGGLSGIGADNQPLGLLNDPELNTYAVGGAFTFDKQLSALAECWADNVEPTHMIYNDDVRLSISKFKDGDGAYLSTTGKMPAEVAALNKLTSTAVTSNVAGTHVSYIGDFSQTMFVFRGDQLRVELGHYGTTFAQKQIGIRVMAAVDFISLRGSNICRCTGITV